MRQRLLAWAHACALATLLVCATNEARADGHDPTAHEASGDRTLNSHTFIYTTLGDTNSAFVTTHFGIRQGFQFFNVPKGEFENGLSAGGLEENLDLGVRFHERFGIYGTLSANALVGADQFTMIMLGGQLATSGRVGAVVNIARVDSLGLQLAARAFGGAGTGRNVGIRSLIDAMLAAPGETLNDVLNGSLGKYVLTETGSKHGGATFHAAWAPAPVFSLQTTIGAVVTKNTSRPFTGVEYVDVSSTTTSVVSSIAATLDGAAHKVPIAFMGEYLFNGTSTKQDQSGESVSDAQHFFAGGLYYTGRTDLMLGLVGATQVGIKEIEATNSQGVAVKSGKPSLIFGQFVLRYVW